MGALLTPVPADVCSRLSGCSGTWIMPSATAFLTRLVPPRCSFARFVTAVDLGQLVVVSLMCV